MAKKPRKQYPVRTETRTDAAGIVTTKTAYGIDSATIRAVPGEALTADLMRSFAAEAPSPEERLAAIQDVARRVLRGAGLPTDLEPRWCGPPGGLMRQYQPGDPFGEVGISYTWWYVLVEERSGPESAQRKAKDLLLRAEGLLRAIQDPKQRDLLWHVLEFAASYSRLVNQLSGVNDRVEEARSIDAGRKAGRNATADRRACVDRVVREEAEAYCRNNPALARNAQSIAVGIQEAVNARLIGAGYSAVRTDTIRKKIGKL